MHQMIYEMYVIWKIFLLLYIRMRLRISSRMPKPMKATVWMNIIEPPSPNHAVSENGIYMLRKITANRTEKVTVPISWYFPRRYPGILS
jgi:hypothetical protein